MMFRKNDRKKVQYTEPDHRPVLPELRGPKDPIDFAIRSARTRYEEINPNDHKNWR